ncbi:2,3-dihydroxybiphenyl 1,2-dioxygenase, partial [Mycobacterium sp. ITM-2017-0098]
RNPVIKVQDIAWLEIEKPDLLRAEAFAQAFGFSTALRTDDELHLRGADPGAPCLIVRRGTRSRFTGFAFTAEDRADLMRLADATGA